MTAFRGELNGQLYMVMQKYDWSRPTREQDPAQAGQGPVRFSIFQ